MSRTTVLALYGGPGSGKSTTAASIFAHLKQEGINAELVTEYVKGWAWTDRKIGPLDQFYLFGKQLHRESNLYGRVDVLVTDSPIGVSAYYANKYAAPEIGAAMIANHAAVRAQRLADYVDVALVRTKAYNPKGRYETEEQARLIDGEMRSFMTDKLGIKFHECGTTDIQAIINLILPLIKISDDTDFLLHSEDR